MLAPVSGSSVAVVGGQQIAPGQAVGISGKRLRLEVPLDKNQKAMFVPAGANAGAGASGQVFVIDAFPPTPDPATPANTLWSVTTLSGVAGSLSVPPSLAVQLQPAASGDTTVGEAAVVQSTTVEGDVTKLTMTGNLSRIYDASTVSVNANAVMATNGQTLQEILGSGDASTDPLQFTLKQGPLTYLSAASGSGSQSTLQVWVNNLRWTEVPNLLSSGPADRSFTTAADAAATRSVTFGDGVHGARPATGTANIRATYRTGIGSAGMVNSGQLTQPLDRPLGLSSVTNPSPASGGADPATADEVRVSAPLPALTIGRIVSLQDYQDFALAFAGIAKALATWTWFGAVRGVFLTVAGTGGATLDSGDPILTALTQAIRLYGEPFVPLQVASYGPALFTFSASVAVEQPSYDPAQVLASVWAALSTAFSFATRSLGQPVAASQIVEIVQQVPGVAAVQLHSLNRSGDAPGAPPPALCAASPKPPTGAELLVLDPATQGAIGLWS
jgi:predicted phage baseplate assembly protein